MTEPGRVGPDLELDADEMVVNILFHALMHGASRISPQVEGLPGWVFVTGQHGYPVAIRTA